MHVKVVQVMCEPWKEPQRIQDRVKEAGVTHVGEGAHTRHWPSTVPQVSHAAQDAGAATTGLGGGQAGPSATACHNTTTQTHAAYC